MSGREKGAIFTIGHSNHPPEKFAGLLQEHGIEVVVDVRSHPYSRYAPHFNERELKDALAGYGIKHLFLGRELGGRPDTDEFYDSEGRVDYAKVARTPEFLESISRLERGIADHRVALLCSEENPGDCHRRLLVGHVLAGRGVSVRHIRGDGSIQAEEEFESSQRTLFGGEEWKSIRPVSRRRPRQSSSGR